MSQFQKYTAHLSLIQDVLHIDGIEEQFADRLAEHNVACQLQLGRLAVRMERVARNVAHRYKRNLNNGGQEPFPMGRPAIFWVRPDLSRVATIIM